MVTDKILKEQFNNLLQQTIEVEEESVKSPDFFQDNNTTTRIKSRNFLSNITSNSVNDTDVFDKNFCFDTYALETKNLNPFSLERKISDQNKHETIDMLWKECMPAEFYEFLCKQENFSYLNGKNVLHPRVADTVWRFICDGEDNYKKLCENLRKYKNIFQYVYASVYPDVYCNSERCGFDLKREFQVKFKEYKDKKKLNI